jgi:hypothetical protein
MKLALPATSTVPEVGANWVIAPAADAKGASTAMPANERKRVHSQTTALPEIALTVMCET